MGKTEGLEAERGRSSDYEASSLREESSVRSKAITSQHGRSDRPFPSLDGFARAEGAHSVLRSKPRLVLLVCLRRDSVTKYDEERLHRISHRDCAAKLRHETLQRV